MKFFKLLLSCAAIFALAACQEEDFGAPLVKLDQSELTFAKDGAPQTINLVATRDWSVNWTEKWVEVTPSSGSASLLPQKITISVLANDGMDREAKLNFTIGLKETSLTVTQEGPAGSEADALMYYNNFDKALVEKLSSGWPYLNQTDCWRGETGKGANGVTYEYKNMSVRNSGKASNDSGSSLYEGSGVNKIFFGKTPWLVVKNIAVDGSDFKLSFGGNKYGQDNPDNTFNHDEFKVYVASGDSKWVGIDYSFATGADPNASWDLASGTFSVPAGTTSLSICLKCSAESIYSIDDLKLEKANEAGKAIDFSAGETLDLSGGTVVDGSGGTTPENPGEAVTIAKIYEDGVGSYKVENAIVVAIADTKAAVISDGTAAIYLYKNNHGLKLGDKITVDGKVELYYNVYEYNNPSVTTTGTGEVKHPQVNAWNGPAFDAYYTTTPYMTEYVSVTGLVSVDGSYVNLAPDGATCGAVASLYGSDLAAYEGQVVTATGYVYNVNTSKSYISIAVTGVTVASGAKYFSVSPVEVNVKADATEASFNVKANVAWTASCASSAAVLDKVSGEADASIKLTFPANTSESPVEYEVVVTTTDDAVTKKTYTVKVTQKGVSAAGEMNFESNVAWTLGTSSYSEKANINGVADVPVLKLGTSKAAGSATITIPAGATKVTFFGVSWKGKQATLSVKNGDTEVYSQALAANDGATNNSPYTMTVSESDRYVINLGSALPASTDFTVTTTGSNTRVILFGINAE